jgi:hypothetical protein
MASCYELFLAKKCMNMYINWLTDKICLTVSFIIDDLLFNPN